MLIDLDIEDQALDEEEIVDEIKDDQEIDGAKKFNKIVSLADQEDDLKQFDQIR